MHNCIVLEEGFEHDNLDYDGDPRRPLIQPKVRYACKDGEWSIIDETNFYHLSDFDKPVHRGGEAIDQLRKTAFQTL